MYQRTDNRTVEAAIITTASNEVNTEQPVVDVLTGATRSELQSAQEAYKQDKDSESYQQLPPVTTARKMNDVIAPISFSQASDEVVQTISQRSRGLIILQWR
jgi:hypothetical protein